MDLKNNVDIFMNYNENINIKKEVDSKYKGFK